MKDEFILKELWLLTASSSLQHSKIYIAGVSEEQKTIFRDKIFQKVLRLSEEYKNIRVAEEKHLINIETIQLFSEQFKDILEGGKLNFGISQKLLNLFLKYLWCLNKITTPPHFPVDRIIQKELGIKETEICPWTQMETNKDYLAIITRAKEMLPKTSFKSLAELELELYSKGN